MIKILEDKIIRASNKYYSGQAIISDQRFDSLLDQLKELDPNNSLLTRIGYGYKPLRAKFKHKYGLVGSLEKVKEIELIYNKLKGKIIITPKLDGSSVTVEYKNGKLFQALTRGNGEMGINITHHISKIVPCEILYKEGSICFRGECVCKKETFNKKYSKLYANPRNMVAGVLNRIEENDIVKDFDIVFYSMIKNHFQTKVQVLNFIEIQGLKAVKYEELSKNSQINDLKSFIDIEYSTDGLVCTEDSFLNYKEYSLALKFEAESCSAEIDYLEWSTGTTGRIIPVIVLKEEVSLSGTKVRRITGNNYKNILDNNINENAIIEVCKSNEIIPMVKKVIKESDIVLDLENFVCPTCKSKVFKKGVDLICSNNLCFAKQYSAIHKVLEIARIPEGLSTITIKKWLEFNKIDKITDLVIKSSNLLCNGFEGHYGKLLLKMEKNLSEKILKGFSAEEFWYFINLPGLGKKVAKKLSFHNVYELNLLNENGNIPSNVVQAILDNQEYIKECLEVFKPINIKSEKIKFKIAVTGALSIPRKEFIKEMQLKNVEVGSISRTTSYLICNSESNLGSKIRKANEMDIKIIKENVLRDILKEENCE